MTTWAELLHQELAASATDALEYLQDALAEENPGVLLVALKHVVEARGSLDRLGLSAEEMTAMLNVLSKNLRPEQFPQAA